MKAREQGHKERTRSNLEEYDLLVLGSGTADKLLSWTQAKAGMKKSDRAWKRARGYSR